MHPETLKDRESMEANKYDRRADQILQAKSVDELFVEPVHWQKIINARRPYGSYINSIKALGNLEGKRVLEIGCGTGWLSVVLCKMGAQVDGIDISQNQVAIAENRADVNHIANQARFRVMSAHKLDFPDDTFDVVYGLSVLHHVNILECIPEVNRVLKKGGKAVFSEPVINSRFVEAIRKKIPVPIDDDDEILAPPLNDANLRILIDSFSQSRISYFRFFSSLDRVVQNRPFVRALQGIDAMVLRFWPFRNLARQAVVSLIK